NQYENRKTQVLVSRIRDVQYTVVDSEFEALLLENNLIKEFQPRYNIDWKDDKSYPFIRLTHERFPKIFPTRNPVKDGSEYFGPYGSVRMMHTMLELVRSVYPMRNCNLNLSEANIRAGKFKTCLEYQIGNCKGPCEGLQSEIDYMLAIENVRKILRGNVGEVIQYLKTEMALAASELRFEVAAEYKKKLDILENYKGKSTVVTQVRDDVDVFNIADSGKSAFINYLKVNHGIIIQTQTLEYKKRMDEMPEELLEMAIAEMRNRYNSKAKEIIVPYELDIQAENIKFTVPKSGDKKKLLELSLKNALVYKNDKISQNEKLNPDLKIERVLTQMKNDLRLTELPAHIECFDNSNIQGKYPVSAMVCFKNAKASKKDYRHFNVRTVEGPDDFATMREVITRRYKRLVEENAPLPQLIVIDGGKGQLSAAVESLKELNLYGKIAVIGIAKRLEEIYYPEDPFPLYIDKKSETLRIIQQMRDEAHRFGITHHRSRRDKGTLVTELTGIKGIGDETSRLLLTHFKSVKKIREAKPEEIEALIGKSKSKLLMDYFSG
ncbi:MAG TPA: excinuclease ABC subunit UvrC, partial [Bacteroidia bacterium]|nr:excinuclease ABC subunit UvrC [Bacteroidia bacterium]